MIKIIKKILCLIEKEDENIKARRNFKSIQIDETMMNFKAKGHRGRSSANKYDALIIVECKIKFSKVFACILKDKRESTILTIFQKHLVLGTTVYTKNNHLIEI
ncbi:hypothetical protein H311_02045 [Anncaliia algerae PRA109]|nr:hypothetical protein H311_02045 [Anncaliia algerae PRA109]